MEGEVDIKTMMNQNFETKTEFFSLFDILNKSEEFNNSGKVIKCQIEGKIKFFRLRSCELFFSVHQCVMLNFQDLTHIYDLFEEKNKNQV